LQHGLQNLNVLTDLSKAFWQYKMSSLEIVGNQQDKVLSNTVQRSESMQKQKCIHELHVALANIELGAVPAMYG
jgi:hypothetical protein